jgi:hypothetical protein
VHPSADGYSHADGPRGRVVTREWIVEEHHQPVAREMLERALELKDQLAQRGVVLVQDTHYLLGLGRLGESGEPTQVAEDDDDLPAMAVEERLVA